ncbi:MAG: amidohydrolase family protein [Deltaproteobacteria bacterium]|nr:amidohydrolase family protein [Deltaproteobacteria bacterium]MBW2359964.1 amidohydrolase family protein [Deltaproteobacteria bacterium]
MSEALTPEQIRERIGHPVIDTDGHTTEFVPALAEYLKEVGISTDFNELFRGVLGSVADWYEMTPDERQRKHITKPPWWTRPMRRTRDRAAASFPRYLRTRMDEFGCDVSLVYPSTALGFFQLRSDELRRGGCRALNRYHRDAFDGCTDRLIPVAAVPTHTPQEAIEELEYAVVDLGFRAVVIPSYVPRPVPGFEQADDDVRRWAFWLDTYGIDSAHDYDPFWQRCLELGVSLGTHSQGNGWGSRRSPSNWVYNHIGHFAASGEALCKSLFLGGVTRRFPDLRVALLEGGVGWACSLFGDLIEHWETRNIRTIREELDPQLLDQAEFQRLAAEYGPVGPATRERIEGAVLTTPGHQKGRPSDDELDEFKALDLRGPEDIPDLFLPNFYFGCEPDDPMNVLAFQEGLWPYGATFNAVYGSDFGHFDVPDMTEVLQEAYRPVQKGTLKPEHFRDFVFANPVRFYTDTNPGFFADTVVADDVQRLIGPARDDG